MARKPLARTALLLALLSGLCASAAGGPATGAPARSELCVMNRDGTGLRVLHGGEGVVLGLPEWSPDGRRIALPVAPRPGTPPDLFAVDVEGGPPRSLTRTAGAEGGADWSPDGQLILFHRVEGGEGSEGTAGTGGTQGPTADLWVVRPDGTGERRLTDDAALDLEPAWSPAGDRIAWVRDAGRPDLYVMRADGEERRRLSRDQIHPARPAWCPDGRRLLVIGPPATNRGITRVDAGGGEEIVLTNGTGSSPDWCPDARRIAYACRREGAGSSSDIHVIDAEGRGQSNLTARAGEEFSPRWAPDGRAILFVGPGAKGLDRNLWTMRPDGGGKLRLTQSTYPDVDLDPAWSPDGRRIAFVRRRAAGVGGG